MMPKFDTPRALLAAPLVLAVVAGPFACSETMSAGFAVPSEAGAGDAAAAFTNPDNVPSEPDAGLVSYCPATKCPSPLTTCSDSRFPCDVNLMTDSSNCGSCGFQCEGSGNARFNCISGKCAMRCRAEWPLWTADCNGIIDDDCEVTFGTNDNCGGCGDACPDPANPCIFDDTTGKGKCGCGAGFLYCSGGCVDPSVSDKNCGACGNACDPMGDGGSASPHAHYGCLNAECGHEKCDDKYANCDNDLANGCETSLLTTASCGACNKACDPGQTCRANNRGQPECVCPPGETLCGERCVNLGVDPTNCGGCGTDCSRIGTNKNGAAFCSYGSCGYVCQQGWGDCNGNPEDGCEVNLGSDQQNCGACGRPCDAVAGQPCIAGQCAVEPCSEGAGTAR